ncbi:MAG: dihydroorotase family protein [Anaerolineae bacterium]|nr:dihydroorotase family protein [Anaerolineae bacterium]
MSALLVRGGTLVTPGGTMRGDVLLEGERIAAVGAGLPRPAAAQALDADGLLVLPGLIDPHVHLREPGGTHKEDFTSGTAAALAGGFTAVLAMPNTDPPITDRATLQEAIRLVQARALCDVGLFLGATAENAAEAAALAEPVGLKLYMGASTGDLLVADVAGLVAHFGAYPPPRPLAVHAEDDEAVAWFTARGQGRPPLCAHLALARALTLAGHFRRRLHVCHLSTGEELAMVRAARQHGLPVTCEVTPHHLFLHSGNAQQLGPLGRVNPPLRQPADVAALWAGLEAVDCIASDHAPHTLEEKQCQHPAAGLPGLETALPLLLTAAAAGRITLPTISRLMGEGPARAFGLQHKGRLAPGCDADLTLVDPTAEWTVGEPPFHTRCGWSPFAGWKIKGRVERVFLRGQLAYAAGHLLLEPGSGRLLLPTS